MKHILIDYENIQPNSLDLLERADNYHVWLFLGPNQQQTLPYSFVKSLLNFKNEHIQFIEMRQSGKKALEQYLPFYLGRIATLNKTQNDKQKEKTEIYIFAEDEGYEAILSHIHENYAFIDIFRMKTMLNIAQPLNSTNIKTEQDNRHIHQTKKYKDHNTKDSLILPNELIQSTITKDSVNKQPSHTTHSNENTQLNSKLETKNPTDMTHPYAYSLQLKF